MGCKLNIGCGMDIRLGYMNLDKYPVSVFVKQYDLEQQWLPCGVGEAEEILCQNVLEHVNDLVAVVSGLSRCLARGGRLKVRVPHFTSRNNATDPTHKRQFSIRTFATFVRGTTDRPSTRSHYQPVLFERQVLARITFARLIWPLGWGNAILAWLVNLHPVCQDGYEETFLRALFPAENILVELEK